MKRALATLAQLLFWSLALGVAFAVCVSSCNFVLKHCNPTTHKK